MRRAKWLTMLAILAVCAISAGPVEATGYGSHERYRTIIADDWYGRPSLVVAPRRFVHRPFVHRPFVHRGAPPPPAFYRPGLWYEPYGR